MTKILQSMAPAQGMWLSPGPTPARFQVTRSRTVEGSRDCLQMTRLPRLSNLPPLVQPKLRIGSPNDRYEQEADRVADAVMRMPEPATTGTEEKEEEEELRAKPLASQITPLAQRVPDEMAEGAGEEEEEPLQTKLVSEPSVQRQQEAESTEEGRIQTKRGAAPTPKAGLSLPARIRSLKGGGRTLPLSERRFFESRLGSDFSQVRVHTDRVAARTARTLNARAFTIGRDLVFGERQFSPHTAKGRHLLAHELTHVLQQTGTSGQHARPHTLRTRLGHRG